MKKSAEQAVYNGTDRLTASQKFIFIPNSEEQRRAADVIRNNAVTFVRGPAASGKSHVSLGVAAELVISGKMKKIVIARPLVPAGELTGFLPGDLQAKLDPWLQGFKDCLESLTFQDPDEFFAKFVDVQAVALLRGRTLSRCVTIVDESQNLSPLQLRMILGRLGKFGKMILVGDVEQTDTRQASLFDAFADAVAGLTAEDDGEAHTAAKVTLTRNCRHPLVAKMIEATRTIGDNQLSEYRA